MLQEALLKRPADIIISPGEGAASEKVPLPRTLYGKGRANSRGVELGHRASLEALLSETAARQGSYWPSLPGRFGRALAGDERPVMSPIDGATRAGQVAEACLRESRRDGGRPAGLRAWSEMPVERRAALRSTGPPNS